MKVIFFNALRKSEMDVLVKYYYDDLLAQAVMGVVEINKLESTKSKHVFDGIGNHEIDISTRFAFLNNQHARVEKFSVFILAKKGFENLEVIDGLPYRAYLDENGIVQIRTWAIWHLENNTSIIRENLNWVLIRTEVLNTELTDDELSILSNSMSTSQPDLFKPGEFTLWGLKEFQELESQYFPAAGS